MCVRDLGSKNGSEFGTQRLEPNRETPWPNGTLLRFGSNSFALSDPVLETLGELEAAVDEQLRPDDPIEASGAVRIRHDREPERGNESDPRAARRGPIAEVPTGERRAAQSAPPGSGLRAADLFIALFALLVLALSGIGLFWLLPLKSGRLIIAAVGVALEREEREAGLAIGRRVRRGKAAGFKSRTSTLPSLISEITASNVPWHVEVDPREEVVLATVAELEARQGIMRQLLDRAQRARSISGRPSALQRP